MWSKMLLKFALCVLEYARNLSRSQRRMSLHYMSFPLPRKGVCTIAHRIPRAFDGLNAAVWLEVGSEDLFVLFRGQDTVAYLESMSDMVIDC